MAEVQEEMSDIEVDSALELSAPSLISTSTDEKLVAAHAAHKSGLSAEIPVSLKNFVVADIPEKIKQELAHLLDINKHDAQDWKYLADHLGMSYPEIRHIESGAKYPLSPTREVLKRFNQKNLYEVLNVISEKMGRFDVIIALIPLLKNLKKSKEICYGSDEYSNAAYDMVGESSNSIISEVASVSSSAIRQQNLINQILEQSQESEQSVIFITHADDVPNAKLRQFCKNLRKYSEDLSGGVVITQNDDDPLKNIDNSGWLERTFRTAKHVIVLVSPGYHTLCFSKSLVMASNASSRSTAFIYNMICSELHSNGGKNFRFRPVIFEEQHRQYVTGCLLNTTVYCWPEQQPQMFTLLFGNSARYSDPKNKMITM